MRRIARVATLRRPACLHTWMLATMLIGTMAGCAVASPTATSGTIPGTTPGTTLHTSSAACVPNDQDQYVYQPTRLRVLQACVHISGVVEAVERDGVDGDITLLVRPDPPYTHLLTARNREAQQGNLVVEPVCMLQSLQPGSIALCASDPSPYPGPLPQPGSHVWMEGRYVLDLNHGAWAELHPLYRAGLVTP